MEMRKSYFASFQAILCFFMLVYIHVKFTRNPVHCLEGVKDTWPRDGILRVEIMRDAPDDYDVEKSYGNSNTGCYC